MKNVLPALAIILFTSSLKGQYYYGDIIGSQESARLMKSYVDNRVRTVSTTGYDENNVKAGDYTEYHEVKENGSLLKISKFAGTDKTVSYQRFDPQGRLASVRDSSAMGLSESVYSYDAMGRISNIRNTSTDSSSEFNQVETHYWFYNSAGKPARMLRVITGTEQPIPDSLEVRFIADENGYPGDEKNYRRGVETSTLYYYYDEKGRITDIVRYNTKLGKLLPDVMFEYDQSDRVIQRITTTSDRTVGYLIWRYLFDEKGLKTKEALFDNFKQLKGKIEYAYSFGS